MKKYIILFLLPIIFFGCEKDFDGVVEPQQSTYRVIASSSFDVFFYSQADSTLRLFIKLDTTSQVSQIYFNVFSSENKKLNSSPIVLLDNGEITNADTIANDFIFSNKFDLSIFNPNGRYSIQYYITDTNDKTKLAATQSFNYYNGQTPVPPIISNTNIEPDTVVVTGTTFLFTSVQVVDPNGSSDIEEVYFIVTRPNGTSNNIKWLLLDDGTGGDLTAGDGIYSLTMMVDQANMKGTYRFEFQAKDRSDLLSNTINHFVLIQ